MEVSLFGAPETPSPPAQAHPHSRQMGLIEPKRLWSFEKLLKNPIPKDAVGYLKQMLSAMVSAQIETK